LSKKTRKFDFDFVREDDNAVFRNFQDDKFFGFYVSKRVLDFRQFGRSFVSEMDGVEFFCEEFFYSLDKFEFRNCSNFVNLVFGLGYGKGSSGFDFSSSEVELNVNERRVLHAMVMNPELTSAEIAKRVWVSNPTVIKVRNKLIDENFICPYVAIDFRKLGFGFLGRISCSFSSGLMDCPLNGGYDARVLLRVRGENRVVDFVLFSSERDFYDELEMMREAYRERGVYVDLEGEVFALQKRGKNMLGLAGFMEDLLFKGVSLAK
jgi:DNA-binding Lrp family transcriptional regulator